MRTHKLMLNADSETISALNRARNAKAAAALMLVFSLAVIALTAPARASASQVSIEPSPLSSSNPIRITLPACPVLDANRVERIRRPYAA